MDYNARYYSAVLGRFISPDMVVPGGENPQAWNRYAYTFNNPLKYTDPDGHEPCGVGNKEKCLPGAGYKPCLDEECNWSKLSSGKVVWKGEGPNPATKAYGGCEDTLANCFEKWGTLKKFDPYENVDPQEIEDLANAIYDDLQTQDTSLWNDWVNYGSAGGRYGYDTPLWNGGGFDTVICIGEDGCSPRSHVNYIAQGMWGAAAGAPRSVTALAPYPWNWRAHQHNPEEGEIEWTKKGWDMYWEIDEERNPSYVTMDGTE